MIKAKYYLLFGWVFIIAGNTEPNHSLAFMCDCLAAISLITGIVFGILGE